MLILLVCKWSETYMEGSQAALSTSDLKLLVAAKEKAERETAVAAAAAAPAVAPAAAAEGRFASSVVELR